MRKDWENTDKATQWIHQRAASPHQPFALYLGLNLPHPYETESLGPNAGGSTFLTSPYWLTKACCSFSYVNIFSPFLENPVVCLHINHQQVVVFISHTQVSTELISVPKWLPTSAMHPVDYYSTSTKNCSDDFTEEEIKRIRGYYYAMCAEADAMLG